MIRLYEIPLLFADFETLLTESAGELTPELEAAWTQLQIDAPEKVEAALCVLKQLAADQESLKQEYDRLHARADSLENAQVRLKALLLPAVQALGGKVKTPKFTTSVTTRKGQAFDLKPGTEVFELPPEFIRVRDPEINKAALKDAFKAGQAMPEGVVVTETETVFLTVR